MTTKLTVAFVHVRTICPQFMAKVMIAAVAAIHILEEKRKHTHTEWLKMCRVTAELFYRNSIFMGEFLKYLYIYYDRTI